MIQGQDSVPAGRGWRASSVTSVRTDTGTWTERRDVSPAAAILLTLSPTSVTRQERRHRPVQVNVAAAFSVFTSRRRNRIMEQSFYIQIKVKHVGIFNFKAALFNSFTFEQQTLTSVLARSA